MSKKSIKTFAELHSMMKKTATEAEAKNEIKTLMKGEFGTARDKRPTLPVFPGRKTPRNLSANDKFVVDTLAVPLEQLSVDQLQNARDTVREAMEYTQQTLVSIRRQLESTENPPEETWRRRAESAARFKVYEGQELQKRLLRIDELIAQSKPQLKLVVTPPVEVKPAPPPPRVEVKPPAPPPAPAGAYEIRTDTPRPNVHHTDEWRKYPFEKLGINQSFRFGTETIDQVRRFVSTAQRHLGRHFSYRTEPDGVLAVWRVEAPRPTRRK